jgi:hypothetical protein
MMENTSFLLSGNSSDIGNNNLAIREFPYWQPTLAVIVFLLIISHAGSILIIYVPLLVVLLRVVKKDHFKALNLLHASIVIISIVEDICHTILYPIYLPSAFRFCTCSALLNTLLAVTFSFGLIYRPFCFSCLSVLQFLVVIGKKKFITLKVSSGMIAACCASAIFFAASIVKPTYDSIDRTACYESFCPGSRPDSPFGDNSMWITTTLSIFFVGYLPTTVIVFTTSIWSCTAFKNYYTGGDDQLNRRMLSLPFIMPLSNLASGLFEGATITLVGVIISMLSLGDLFPYWTMFTIFVLASFLRFLIRLVYPLMLLYTHRKLRRAIKRLVRELKNGNIMTPGTVNIDSTTVDQ